MSERPLPRFWVRDKDRVESETAFVDLVLVVSNTESEKTRQPLALQRRTVLQAALGACLICPHQADAQTPATQEEPPHEGDSLVFATGPRAGEVIAPQDVPLGGPQVFAYPRDPASGAARKGSRLNQVLLVRLDPADLTPQTSERAADGIVAYSAVCSHTGCDVNGWLKRTSTLHCECHDSEFNPADAANVELGPAPRRLAALPLRITNGALEVAGSFIGRVGAAQ